MDPVQPEAEQTPHPRERLAKLLQPGLDRLGGAAHVAGPMQEALRWQALDLCRRGKHPTDKTLLPTRFVEAELTRATRRSAMTAEAWQVLLTSYQRLAVQAGWLTQDLRFAMPEIAQLIVGLAIVEDGKQGPRLREPVGRHRSWAEATEVAAGLGDPLDPWLALLEAETDPLTYLERALVTLQAIGATPDPRVPEPLRGSLRAALLQLLVVLAPEREPSSERAFTRPLLLEPLLWTRCTIHLARWSLHDPAASISVAAAFPTPLAQLLSAALLPERLDATDRASLLALCAPADALSMGILPQEAWPKVGSKLNWIWRGSPYLQEVFLPLLFQYDAALAALWIVSPGQSGLSGFVMNREEFHRWWLQALGELLATGALSAALDGFTECLQQLAWDPIARPLFERARALFVQHGTWPAARERLQARFTDEKWLKTAFEMREGASDFLPQLIQAAALDSFELTEVLKSWPAEQTPFVVLQQLHRLGVAPEVLLERWLPYLVTSRVYANQVPADDVRHREMSWWLDECPSPLLNALSTALPKALATLEDDTTSRQIPRTAPLLLRLLQTLPAGVWLEKLRDAAPQSRRVLLGFLATHALEEDLRRAALKELLS